MAKRVAIVGSGQTDHAGSRPDVTGVELINEAVTRALEDTGLTRDDIDGVVVGNMDHFEGINGVELWSIDGNGGLLKPTIKLTTGDYCLKGYPLLIERKGSISEMFQNVTPPDLQRFRSAIRRLGDPEKYSAEPNILMLCLSPQEFRPSVPGWMIRNGKNVRTTVDGEFVLGRLLEEIENLALDLWIVGRLSSSSQRRDVGRLVLHRLLRQQSY